jgi:hypothetical protein
MDWAAELMPFQVLNSAGTELTKRKEQTITISRMSSTTGPSDTGSLLSHRNDGPRIFFGWHCEDSKSAFL